VKKLVDEDFKAKEADFARRIDEKRRHRVRIFWIREANRPQQKSHTKISTRSRDFQKEWQHILKRPKDDLFEYSVINLISNHISGGRYPVVVSARVDDDSHCGNRTPVQIGPNIW
jgi:hypothetical protein